MINFIKVFKENHHRKIFNEKMVSAYQTMISSSYLKDRFIVYWNYTQLTYSRRLARSDIVE